MKITQMNLKQIVSLALAIIIVLNFILFVTGVIPATLFWIIIILAFIYLYFSKRSGQNAR